MTIFGDKNSKMEQKFTKNMEICIILEQDTYIKVLAILDF